MHSYVLTGIRMGPLVRLLRKNGFTPAPRKLGGLLFLLQNALWSSILTWRENKRFAETIKAFPVPDDPIIIIGHWRTGSTFLHHLLARDDRFISPTLFQCSFPECFRTAEPFYRPIMGNIVKKRPMDNMDFGFDDAQEDEFAWIKLAPGSPLLKVIFPEKEEYFINDFQDFIPEEKDKAAWKEQMRLFSANVSQNTGRTLLLKNPFHSLRIPFLCEVFPKARFIHLHRHPCKVVASSLNLWKVMAQDNQLKGKNYTPSLEEVTRGLVKFYDVIEKDFSKLPAGRCCEVSYDDLEADPRKVVRKIYDTLGVPFSHETELKINSQLEKVKDFRKNSYTFDDNQRKQVAELMKEVFKKYQYEV